MDEAGTQPAQNASVAQTGFVVHAKIEKLFTCGSAFRQPWFLIPLFALAGCFLTLCSRFSLDLFAKWACRRNCFLQHAPAYRKSPPTASFSDIFSVSLSPLRGSRAGNAVRKPCCTRLPNPPHMSLDSDCYWRASALQTSQEGFGTVCGALPTGERLSVLGMPAHQNDWLTLS